MTTPVKTRLIRVGNSQGIRIPKLLVEQAGLEGEVELEARFGQLIIRPVRRPRQAWEAAFQRMAESGDDHLLDSETFLPTAWETAEWQW